MRAPLLLLHASLFSLLVGCGDKDSNDSPPDDTSAEGDADTDTDADTDADSDVDDTGCEQTWYFDADLDGWGDPATAVDACEAPDGYVALGGDCNDHSTVFHPFAEDVIGDTFDHDCDGLDCQSLTTGDAHFAVCLTFKNHEDSRSVCTGAGLEVASVHSVEENETVAWAMDGLGTGFVWMGATDSATEGTFVWADGSALDYENWASGQPDDDGGEDCLLIQANLDYAWNDAACSNTAVGGVACQLRR